LLKNEYFRSFGFAFLAAKFNETSSSFFKGFVNVYSSFILSTFLTIFLITISCLSLLDIIPDIYLIVIFCIYFILNIRFLNFFEQARGFFAMVTIIPLLFIDQFTCLIGSFLGTMKGIYVKFSNRFKK